MGLSANSNNEDLSNALDAALREAADDDTFRKVRRISFACQANDEVRLNNIK